MEQRYKMALEAIVALMEIDTYADKKVIKAICETALFEPALKESEDKDI